MTREEELDWLYRLKSEIYVYMPKEWLIPMNNALDMAISALSAEPCDDCISRKEVINAIDERERVDGNVNAEDIRTDICLLPSVQPIRPKGEWIEHEMVYECSNCQIIRAKGTTGKYIFCPNCGADMRGNADAER